MSLHVRMQVLACCHAATLITRPSCHHQMPIWDHLEELRERVVVGALAAAVAVLTCFAFSKDLVVFLEAPVASQGVRFLQLSPGEFFFTTLKVGPAWPPCSVPALVVVTARQHSACRSCRTAATEPAYCSLLVCMCRTTPQHAKPRVSRLEAMAPAKLRGCLTAAVVPCMCRWQAMQACCWRPRPCCTRSWHTWCRG